MQEEVDVRVDHARHERGGAEIDDRCAGRMLNGRSDGGNVVVLDEDFSGRDQHAFFNVEQVRGVEDDGSDDAGGYVASCLGGRLVLGCERKRQESRCEESRKDVSRGHDRNSTAFSHPTDGDLSVGARLDCASGDTRSRQSIGYSSPAPEGRGSRF